MQDLSPHYFIICVGSFKLNELKGQISSKAHSIILKSNLTLKNTRTCAIMLALKNLEPKRAKQLQN
jgi:hypothetical protein